MRCASAPANRAGTSQPPSGRGSRFSGRTAHFPVQIEGADASTLDFIGQIAEVRGWMTPPEWSRRRGAWADEALARELGSIACSDDNTRLIKPRQPIGPRPQSVGSPTTSGWWTAQLRTQATTTRRRPTHSRTLITTSRVTSTQLRTPTIARRGQPPHRRMLLAAEDRRATALRTPMTTIASADDSTSEVSSEHCKGRRLRRLVNSPLTELRSLRSELRGLRREWAGFHARMPLRGG